MIVVMGMHIASATVADFRQVLTDHSRYWGERDLRSLHLLAPVQEFGSTCMVARAEDGIRRDLPLDVSRPRPARARLGGDAAAGGGVQAETAAGRAGARNVASPSRTPGNTQ